MLRTEDPKVFKTLFHPNYGTRLISINHIVHAEIRPNAYDGSKGTTYKSGWHTLPTLAECTEYRKRFTKRLDRLCIVQCEVRGNTWPKSHSNANVLLSDKIKLLKEVQ